jgi:hypothetical protein
LVVCGDLRFFVEVEVNCELLVVGSGEEGEGLYWFNSMNGETNGSSSSPLSINSEGEGRERGETTVDDVVVVVIVCIDLLRISRL